MTCSTKVSNINKPYVGIWYVIGYAWQTYDAYDSTLPRCTPNVSPWLYKTARAAGISEHQQGFSSRAPEEAPNFRRIRSRIREVTSRRFSPIEKYFKQSSFEYFIDITFDLLMLLLFFSGSSSLSCQMFENVGSIFRCSSFFLSCASINVASISAVGPRKNRKTWNAERRKRCENNKTAVFQNFLSFLSFVFISRKLPQYAADGVPFCGDGQPAQISTLFQKMDQMQLAEEAVILNDLPHHGDVDAEVKSLTWSLNVASITISFMSRRPSLVRQ